MTDDNIRSNYYSSNRAFTLANDGANTKAEKDPLLSPPIFPSENVIRWQTSLSDIPSSDGNNYQSEEIFVDCGPTPSVDCDFIYENYDEEFLTNELNIQMGHDTIKMNLLDHMNSISDNAHFLENIENHTLVQDNIKNYLRNANKVELSICLLWAAFIKRWDLLNELLQLGAQLTYSEPNHGLSALHLAAFSDCITGTQFLIAQGPLHCAAFGDSAEAAMILLNNGAKLQARTTGDTINCNESVLHCAVRANAIACVRLFTVEGADVGQIEFCGKSPIHLAAELGHAESLQIMLEAKGVNVNAKTKDKGMTPLHFAAEGGHTDCVDVLLDKGCDPNVRNNRLQTPLHLAVKAQALECVDWLLQKGNADPRLADWLGRTPLHAAVSNTARSVDIVEVLVSYGAMVNEKDLYGYTPLHIAALNELSECVETLIYNGADVTAKSKLGMTALGTITRKTPASLAVIKQKLDEAITLIQRPAGSSSREVELRMDFNILQQCHPREISFLNTFVDEGQKEVLLHPLCSAFLYLKWRKLRKYYVTRIFFGLMFMCSLSLYVLTTLAGNCYNVDLYDEDIELCEKESIMGYILRSNPLVTKIQWFTLVAITCCEILRKLYGIAGYSSVKQYLLHPENLLEWAVIISVFAISHVYTGRTRTWQSHIGAFAVLSGWTNLMLMVGQLPVFGLYVAMYTKVQGEFAKLLLAYSCLLIGFTISFCVVYPDSNMFANPFISLITVLTMMTGELSIDILIDPDPLQPPLYLEISAQVTYVIFVLFVTVMLMNLLVGIAVHDIQGLQKTAGLHKLVRQTKLISHIETALFNPRLHTCILNMLHWTALVSPNANRVVLNVKPLNPREKRLPRDILKAAYQIARKNRKNNYEVPSPMKSTKNNEKNAANNNNHHHEAKDAFDFSSAGLITLQNKMYDATERIESLTNEITELKQNIANNQTILEQVLSTLVGQREKN